MLNYNNNIAPPIQVIQKDNLFIFLTNFPYIFFLLIQLFLKYFFFKKGINNPTRLI